MPVLQIDRHKERQICNDAAVVTLIMLIHGDWWSLGVPHTLFATLTQNQWFVLTDHKEMCRDHTICLQCTVTSIYQHMMVAAPL